MKLSALHCRNEFPSPVPCVLRASLNGTLEAAKECSEQSGGESWKKMRGSKGSWPAIALAVMPPLNASKLERATVKRET